MLTQHTSEVAMVLGQMSSVERAGATIAYDVRDPRSAGADLPPLVLVGYPMTAEGFGSLAANLPERTIVTLDPRGTGRSTGGSGPADPGENAEDVHAVIQSLNAGPVEVFGSSGGAVTLLELAARHPEVIHAAVAHEPPALAGLPDADLAGRAFARVRQAYAAGGFGAGMAEFIAMTSWTGPFTETYLEGPLASPEQFGLPTQDDGSRDDLLLSPRSDAVASYVPDWEALRSLGPRLALAAGEESRDLLTWRTTHAIADRVGTEVAIFPSNHGGFLGGEFGQQGQPEAFAATLRETLAGIHAAQS
jgi:pimeloyl-ACP methyl ester carboxylesterase